MPDGIAIPALTTDQMREVDRLMVDAYGIALLQMMENAGRHLARHRFLNGDARDHRDDDAGPAQNGPPWQHSRDGRPAPRRHQCALTALRGAVAGPGRAADLCLRRPLLPYSHDR